MPNDKFAIGSLVRVREREWVVQPESYREEDTLILRPLGGSEREKIGVYLPLEEVTSATFPLPSPDRDVGKVLSARLLNDAIRLGTRDGVGPFRSFAKIGIEPRPYQLVPLLLALKQDPVRLLIADDVGIGKTIESLLIARELLDRGEIQRIAVLCPPVLVDQWQKAMREQFNIEAELVLASTAKRLERKCRVSESLFERYPFTIVSMDYIKSPQRREEFLRTCPEFVIVDEAHTCSQTGNVSGSQQRNDLLRALVNPVDDAGNRRHLILVSATPHSGKTEAFRSLLTLLNPVFSDFPDDLSGAVNNDNRKMLAQYLVQRRRADLRHYMGANTVFPDRLIAEESYQMSKPHIDFLKRIIEYCRERIEDPSVDSDKLVQRIRWWSALTILRAFSSSPKAFVTTLRNRREVLEQESLAQINHQTGRAVLDIDDEGMDMPALHHDAVDETHRSRLLRMARDAEARLFGANDNKLQGLLNRVRELIKQGHAPIVFCKFVPTVEYVTEALSKVRGLEVTGITGSIPPSDRKRHIDALSQHPNRVLVCTDCLSEGLDLQHAFDTVIHYDLAWNPTKHEQREGRVDRFGQPKPVVKTITYFGADNAVDGIVLDVLIRKHNHIQDSLGVSIPVPEGDIIQQALKNGLFLRQNKDQDYRQLPLFTDYDLEWERAAESERKSRARFAQHTLHKQIHLELKEVLEQTNKSIGSTEDVQNFVLLVLEQMSISVDEFNQVYTLKLTAKDFAIKEVFDQKEDIRIRFQGVSLSGEHLITRTHPLVSTLSSLILDGALNPSSESIAKRCAVVYSSQLSKPRYLFLLRTRYQMLSATGRSTLAEEQVMVGFEGNPNDPEWLDMAGCEATAQIESDLEGGTKVAKIQITKMTKLFPHYIEEINRQMEERAEVLALAHTKVRKTLNKSSKEIVVTPYTPSDVIGIFAYIPYGRRA